MLGAVAPVLAQAQRPAAAAMALVFDRVTVVDVEQGKLFSDQRVVITGNRIEAVGGTKAVKIPNRAQVVDARGKYVIPGLWDLHLMPTVGLPSSIHCFSRMASPVFATPAPQCRSTH